MKKRPEGPVSQHPLRAVSLYELEARANSEANAALGSTRKTDWWRERSLRKKKRSSKSIANMIDISELSERNIC